MANWMTPLRLALLAQPAKRVFGHGCCPAQIEKALWRPRFERDRRNRESRRRSRHPIVPRNEIDSSPRLCARPVRADSRKKFCNDFSRSARKRPRWDRELEQVAFQHHYKKILSEVLRVASGITVSANESEHRSPVALAKLVERLARFFLFLRIGARKNYAPSRRGESVRHAMHISDCLGGHRRSASYLRNSYASEKGWLDWNCAAKSIAAPRFAGGTRCAWLTRPVAQRVSRWSAARGRAGSSIVFREVDPPLTKGNLSRSGGLCFVLRASSSAV